MSAPDEITDLPAFNDFQQRLRQYVAGHQELIEVEEAYQALETALAGTFAYVFEQLEFQPGSERIEQAEMNLFDCLSSLQAEMPHCWRALQAHDWESAEDHLAMMRHAVQDFLAELADLKKAEAPALECPIPMFNELCRVARLVGSGDLEPERLGLRLDQSWDFYMTLNANLASLRPDSREQAIWESGQETMTRALTAIQQGLEELDHYLQEPQEETLEAALESIRDGAQALVELQASLQRAQFAPSEQACPRCGQVAPLGTRRCSQCGFAFPVQEDQSQLSLGEGGEAPAWPSHIAELLAACDGYRMQGSRDVLEALSSVSQRFESGLQRFVGMEAPRFETVEQEQTWSTFQQGFQECTERALQALDEAAGAVEEEMPALFDRAIEGFLEAVRGLMEVQGQASQIVQSRRPG